MPPFTDTPKGVPGGVRPFASAGEAWSWTARLMQARRDRGQLLFSVETVARPCDPDDVLRAIDRLYRHRILSKAHLRILDAWGRAQRAPCPYLDAEDHRIWQEALLHLAWPPTIRGIIAAPDPPAVPTAAKTVGS